jgi:site-specific DNA recombinase
VNILLSLDQFEREVIRERIRYKMAASRMKGIWMGGYVPLGHDVRDGKLVVNEQDAGAERHLQNRHHFKQSRAAALGKWRGLLKD